MARCPFTCPVLLTSFAFVQRIFSMEPHVEPPAQMATIRMPRLRRANYAVAPAPPVPVPARAHRVRTEI